MRWDEDKCGDRRNGEKWSRGEPDERKRRGEKKSTEWERSITRLCEKR